MKRVAILPVLVAGLWPGAPAAAATTIECPATMTLEATDAGGIRWQAPVSSWLDEMSLDRVDDQPGSQSVTCRFQISGPVQAYVDGDCAMEAGDYAEIEQSDDGGVTTTLCTPSNGRTEECHVTCR